MSHIPDELRRLVRERADNVCEYCLIHERFTIKRHEVDHITAEKMVATHLKRTCALVVMIVTGTKVRI